MSFANPIMEESGQFMAGFIRSGRSGKKYLLLDMSGKTRGSRNFF